MAVESSHLNIFPRQFVQDREIWMNFCKEGQGMDVYKYKYKHEDEQMRFPAMLAGNDQYEEGKSSIKSGVTCKVNSININSNPSWRKRRRDELYAGMPLSSYSSPQMQQRSVYGYQSFPHPQMHPYHQLDLEMDAIICEHTEKLRLELKQNLKVLVTAMGESMIKRVRDKEDEIEKMERWNVMLEEKVKGLYKENNLWRELAQRNEAMANSLQHALHHAQCPTPTPTPTEEESCGSSNDDDDINDYNEKKKKRLMMCRKCGEGRCCVVLLPCRHLCLCALCSSSSTPFHSCPVCNSTITATLHLNMS